MSLIIKKCTISEMELAPNISDLLNEYALESAIDGLPHPAARVETYKHLEAVNAICMIGAFVEEVLIGFIAVLMPVLPHYSVCVAVVESFFVLSEYRKTGAGIKLLREAEEHSIALNAHGILVSTPTGGSLVQVMPHVGYTETNRVFFRSLK